QAHGRHVREIYGVGHGAFRVMPGLGFTSRRTLLQRTPASHCAAWTFPGARRRVEVVGVGVSVLVAGGAKPDLLGRPRRERKPPPPPRFPSRTGPGRTQEVGYDAPQTGR